MGTFCKVELALTPAELAGADVAIVGAPFDEGVSNRPGSRFGPRAIRLVDNFAESPPTRPHMLLGVDPFAELRIVDYGDAECVPAGLEQSHAAVERAVLDILEAGALPIVLGGDHSVAYPNLVAMAKHHGRGAVGVIQFDSHADTADIVWGVRLSHGTPMRLAVDEGWIRGDHFIQVGLRGYWPHASEFDWMRSVGMRWHTMYEVEERGVGAVIDTVVAEASDRLPELVYLIVDVDVLDPGWAPGTGTPEPGGLLPRELLTAVRRLCHELPVAGMEVVEVSPPYDPASVTALVAHRCVTEALSGIALRRKGGPAQPQLPAS